MQQQSIRRKFIFVVGGTIAILLFIAAAMVVSHTASITEDAVSDEVSSLVQREAIKVEQFFYRYGGMARTFLEAPHFQDFFMRHDQRGQRSAGMDQITETFERISGADPNIKSAFFASARTGEYFYEAGNVGVDSDGEHAGDPAHGYFADKRPWFQTAIEQPGFYVSPPAVDSQDGTVSAVVQSPIKVNGRLIGVGGVDILISTIGEVLQDIRYRQQGTAFLLDEAQNIVYFPKQEKSLELSQAISTFDKVFDDTEGFSALASAIRTQQGGMLEVQWRGEAYYAVWQHAKLDDPRMDWSLGILIPASLVAEPINTAMATTMLGSLLFIGIITWVTYVAASKITRPLKRLQDALTDIASGDGDLTRRIDIDTNDEVGRLATQFNRFTDKLRVLLQETASNTKAVADAARQLREVSYSTNKEIQQEKTQVETVTAAVTEMATTVMEVSQNAATASRAADEAEQETGTGTALAQQAMDEIGGLAASIQEAVKVVSGLGKESDNIGAVVDVINSIAEQTNLLALNAAIEAARAGEQGRGFAVVADEVRSLASRTQESTDDIRKMVERLQDMAQRTDTVMQAGNAQTEKGVENAQRVVASIERINASIGTVQEQNRSIAVATEQQTVVAESINQSLVAITDLSDVTATHAEELAREADRLSAVANDLQAVVGQFKV
ncbi:methyl-accepting chemotaxis protein [Aestuariibacter halophilus]|uniref:Methyl-accepting chemotaxis protein n=1 Tax=Fluctibacter halophilus TaxID=226011 RepID=A0ABS8GB97_9ALTE|nr:methyl-accepting chemotaxis protein [Aestuariibacter halophilus]MCC2617673.1 methyl-accepting chemotaxis protein [Aestuariibacter halophilus]